MNLPGTATREAPTLTPPRTKTPIPERDWYSVMQGSHRYRGWVWPGGQLSAAHAARLVAVETLTDWLMEPMADDVALCVSELVSNAVEHAVASGNPLVPHQVVLGLRYFASSCLFVEVGDCDPRPPLLPAPAADDDPLDLLAVSGRGLVIVGELADAVWWTRRAAGGKYVYARLDTPRYFDGERELCDE